MNLMTANREWSVRPADECFESLAELSAAVEARRRVSRQREAAMNKIRVVQDDAGKLRLNGQHAAGVFLAPSYGFGDRWRFAGVFSVSLAFRYLSLRQVIHKISP